MTSLKQTSLFTKETSTSYPVDSLANHIQAQESDLEKMMIDTSSQKCLEQFEKFSRNGSWAKTYSALLIGGGLVFEEVQTDLEAEGYEVQAYILPACSQNAPHKRERTWFVAHSDSARIHKQYISTKSNEKIAHSGLSFKKRDFSAFPTEPPILRRDDGISQRLDSKTFSKWRNQSIKAYGNAIVPQVAYQIFKSISLYQEL